MADIEAFYKLVLEGRYKQAYAVIKVLAYKSPSDRDLAHRHARFHQVISNVGTAADHPGVRVIRIQDLPSYKLFMCEVLWALGKRVQAIDALQVYAMHFPRYVQLRLKLIEYIAAHYQDDAPGRYDALYRAINGFARGDRAALEGSAAFREPICGARIKGGPSGSLLILPASNYLVSPAGLWAWLPLLGDNTHVIFTDWSYLSSLPAVFWQALVPPEARERVFFLTNEPEAHRRRQAAGLTSVIINNNTWINEHGFQLLETGEKVYRAALTARAAGFKRIHLAADVDGLALVTTEPTVAGSMSPSASFRKCKPSYFSQGRLSKPTLNRLYSQAHCGLALSRMEGACYTSSEYLLSGIPVVSTEPEPGESLGGREHWYDHHNSILCLPTERAVAEAVATAVDTQWDREAIRGRHVAQMQAERREFFDVVAAPLMKKLGIEEDYDALMNGYFYEHRLEMWKMCCEGYSLPRSAVTSPT